MDDIFDSLIYIIIALVAFAISALSKKKKKQAQRPPSSYDNQVEDNNDRKTFIPNLEQLIREQIGVQDENIFETEDEVIIDTIPKEESKSEVLDSVPPEMLDNKEDTPYSIEHEDTSKIFSDFELSNVTKEEQEDNTLFDDFDLRKAIVYSEIINRKEY